MKIAVRFSFLNNLVLFSFCLISGCQNKSRDNQRVYPSVGSIERLNTVLDEIIDTSAKIEVLASGFGWAEGPVWIPKDKKLLFTDVKQEMIYEWTEKDSVKIYLNLADADADKPGPSALLVNKNNELIILRYGHGQAVKMKSGIENPSTEFQIIADKYNGMKFNNTNDAAFFKNGDMFMSDPPPVTDSSQRHPGPGLYRVKPDGEVQLVTDTMSSPNGIAFSPDFRTIYVANADSKNAYWMVADIDDEGNVTNGTKFFDATGYAPPEKGHPDGLRVNRNGILFATGPGGIFIFSPQGIHLGTIKNDQFNTNCVLDDTENILYITAGQYLMRVILKK